MTREERIEAALATAGKATDGPWISPEECPDWIAAVRNGETFHVADARGWGTLQKEGQKGCDELSANIALLCAAPDLRDELLALREQVAKQKVALIEIVNIRSRFGEAEDPNPKGFLHMACDLADKALADLGAK